VQGVRIFGGLLVAGVLEIAVLILVGRTIGALPTLLLVLAGMFVGSWLLRRQGRRVLREFSDAAFARRPPSTELGGGVLAAAGALLLMVPGFLTDLAAIAFFLPPTRAFLGRRLRRAAERRAQAVQDRVRNYRRGSGGDYIDGEVISVTEDDEPQDHPRLDPSTQAPRQKHRD
jgi:UPF0716 protein FxsA